MKKSVVLATIFTGLLISTNANAWRVTFEQTFDRGNGYDIKCNSGKTGYVEYLNFYRSYWVGSEHFSSLNQAARHICGGE